MAVRPTQARRWRAAAKVAAVAVGIAALICLWLAVATLFAAGHRSGAQWAGVAAVELLLLAAAAATGWVAWRLWARWTAGTVRVVVGAAVALAVMAGSAATMACLKRAGVPTADLAVFDLLLIAGMSVGALAYRRVTQAVIRSAGLVDPPSIGGWPIGRRGRTRQFCAGMGWATYGALSELTRSLGWRSGPHLADRLGGLAILAPVLIGWGVYRLLSRWLMPRRRDTALPPGGFPVVMGGPVRLGGDAGRRVKCSP